VKRQFLRRKTEINERIRLIIGVLLHLDYMVNSSSASFESTVIQRFTTIHRGLYFFNPFCERLGVFCKRERFPYTCFFIELFFYFFIKRSGF